LGGAAPGPKGREAVCEAEATLSRRVAAEAEAGKATSPTPSRVLGREGKGPMSRLLRVREGRG
jgi:hypothetical protein